MPKHCCNAQEACDAIGAILDRPLPLPGGHIRLMHYDSRRNSRSVILNVYADGGGSVYSFRTNEIVCWGNLKQNRYATHSKKDTVQAKPQMLNSEPLQMLMNVAKPVRNQHPYLENKHLKNYADYPFYEVRRKHVEFVFNRYLRVNAFY